MAKFACVEAEAETQNDTRGFWADQWLWVDELLSLQRGEVSVLLEDQHKRIVDAMRERVQCPTHNVFEERGDMEGRNEVMNERAEANQPRSCVMALTTSATVVSLDVDHQISNARPTEEDVTTGFGFGTLGLAPELEVVEDALCNDVKKVEVACRKIIYELGELEEGHTSTWSERVVTGHHFEMFFAILIVANTLTMCIEAEYRGFGIGEELGIRGMRGLTQGEKDRFKMVEYVFASLFSIEVAAKLVILRWRFFLHWWNIFDIFCIGTAWIDLLTSIDVVFNPMLLRLLRLCRLFRLVRGLSAFEIFDNLHLMIQSIKASAAVLVWVVAIILPIIVSCSLALIFLLIGHLEDEHLDTQARLDCFYYFGTFGRAFVSMFEITFGNWVTICRFFNDRVGPGFAAFVMVYKLVVGLAILRVIYGVFMHMTFSCASSDDEAMIAKKRREIKKYAGKMHELFIEMDESGDGFLSRNEFRQLSHIPKVQVFLAAMDLEIRDAELVFDLLADENEKISAKEMVYGFSRLKGTARSIDCMALISLVRQCMVKMDRLQAVEHADIIKLNKKIDIMSSMVPPQPKIPFSSRRSNEFGSHDRRDRREEATI